jgi:hypothetical protein
MRFEIGGESRKARTACWLGIVEQASLPVHDARASFCSRHNQQRSVQEPWIKGARKLPGSGGASEKMLARHRQAGTPVPLLKKERACMAKRAPFAHKCEV